MIVDNLEFHIKRSGDTAARGTNKLDKSLKNLKKSSGGANKGLSGLMHTIGRLGKMMILRQAIRAVMRALKDGLENAYKFNSMMGGEMSRALDALKSASVQATGAVGSAFGEMIANVAPILIRLLDLISRVANAFAQLMAVLGGRSKYTKAVASSEKWAKATESGAKAAKEWKNQLMGFDEINRLEEPSDSSGGGGADSPFEGAFELADATNEWAAKLREITLDWWNSLNLDPIINAWDRLKTSLKELASVIDQYLYFGYTEVLLPLGTWAIEEGLPAVIHALASAFEFVAEALRVLYPYAVWVYENWLKPLANWVGDHFVWAMWRVQDAFVQAREYIKTLEGLEPAEMVNKLWRDLTDAFQNVNWQGLGAKVIDMLRKALKFVKDAITSASFANIVEKAAEAAGSAIGAGLGIIWGAFLELLQTILNRIMQWSSEMEAAGKDLISGLLEGIWNSIKGIAQWIDDHICRPFINGVKAAFGIHSPSTVMAEIGIDIINGLKNGVVNSFSAIWEAVDGIFQIFASIVTPISELWDAVGNGLSSAFANLGVVAHEWLDDIGIGLQRIIGFCRDAVSGLNAVANKNAARIEADGSQYLTGFASGGFPDEGELFMAREGGMPEMIGRIGNRTAVANNDQIVQAISDGVFSAVVSAMGSSGVGNDQVIKIYMDGREIATTTTKYQKQFARAGVM